MQQFAQEFYFPHLAGGEYVLEKPTHPATGAAVSGGSGFITWFRGTTPIAGATNPVAVTWDNATTSYRAPISADFVTTLGERLIGKVAITAGDGTKYYDVLHVQVRTPSSTS